MRRATALAIILLLGLAPSGGAQEPPGPPPAAQPPAGDEAGSATHSPGGAGLAGSWTGWARLTNDWPGHTCRYESGPDSTTVHLELSAEAGVLKGSTAIDLPAGEGSGCPPLRKRYMITEVVVSEATLSFSDSGGNEWNLSIRRGGGVLQGLLAWRQGGAEEPLAEGFALPDGTKPGARLSGEVRLHREASGEAEGQAAAGQAPAAATEKKATGFGHSMKIVGVILAANVVGIGLLYGINQVGKGSTSSGVITCSPHNCIVGNPGQPCFCENNVLSGASCGDTTAGVPVGGACNLPSKPCQSGFSCNSGVCEDRFGRCPY